MFSKSVPLFCYSLRPVYIIWAAGCLSYGNAVLTNFIVEKTQKISHGSCLKMLHTCFVTCVKVHP